MIIDCKNCGPLSEIALITDQDTEIYCVRCNQAVKRRTRGAAVIAWNCKQEKERQESPLWDEQTEETFNRIMMGGIENV